VWLARIRRPQGRKGEVFADILTDFPEKFAERRQLWLLAPDSPQRDVSAQKSGAPGLASETRETSPVPREARQIDLASHWLHKGGVVLHFAGVDSISAAEALKGAIVAIPRSERAPLPAGETYVGDLIGCALVDVAAANPVSVGEIAGVDFPAGAAPLLVVQSPSGEVLIPFAKSYLRRIDLDARRVEMALPEGLVDLNAR
jgi:16S rRNA processing protein RimM